LFIEVYLTGLAGAIIVRIGLLVSVKRPEGAGYRAFSGC
jgi:hypothetical protein